jgi:hypothetical protein
MTSCAKTVSGSFCSHIARGFTLPFLPLQEIRVDFVGIYTGDIHSALAIDVEW